MTVSPLQGFEWPDKPSVASLGKAIGKARGLAVVIREIPPELSNAQVSGLTVVTSGTAQVFYDENLSPLNRIQTILHEFAHILHGDIGTAEGQTHAARSSQSDPTERRAERTGTMLMERLHRKQRSSNVLDFLSGLEVPADEA